MKTKLTALPVFALGAALITSCTTAQPTANAPANDSRQAASSDRRSYTQEELQKRGRPTLGGALEAQDTTVQITGAH